MQLSSELSETELWLLQNVNKSRIRLRLPITLGSDFDKTPIFSLMDMWVYIQRKEEKCSALRMLGSDSEPVNFVAKMGRLRMNNNNVMEHVVEL